MDRERWQSYPLRSEEERLFFRLLSRQAASDERTVTVESEEGKIRRLTVRRTLAVEEPGPVSGSAVCRITFVDGTLAPGERVKEDLWLLASELLEAAESRARAGGERETPKKKTKKAPPRPMVKRKAKAKTKPKAKPKPAAKKKTPGKTTAKKSPGKRSR